MPGISGSNTANANFLYWGKFILPVNRVIDKSGSDFNGSQYFSRPPCISHLDSKDTLSKKNVSDGSVDIQVLGLTSVDHESINELHALSPLSSQLTAHNNLSEKGCDEFQNIIVEMCNKFADAVTLTQACG